MCRSECATGEAPVVVAEVAATDTECPLHPAQEQAPAHDSDSCTHNHGTVQEAPESPSALAPSASPSLALLVATFSWTAPDIAVAHRGHAVASPPVDRSPHLLALRI